MTTPNTSSKVGNDDDIMSSKVYCDMCLGDKDAERGPAL